MIFIFNYLQLIYHFICIHLISHTNLHPMLWLLFHSSHDLQRFIEYFRFSNCPYFMYTQKIHSLIFTLSFCGRAGFPLLLCLTQFVCLFCHRSLEDLRCPFRVRPRCLMHICSNLHYVELCQLDVLESSLTSRRVRQYVG